MTHPRVIGAAAGRILVGALVLSLSGQCVLSAAPTKILGAEPTENISPDTSSSVPNLKTSIAREAKALALLQTSSGTGTNKYFWPGIAMMAGGGIMLVKGLSEDAITCTTVGQYGFDCGAGKAYGLAFGGLAVAGVGALLFIRGEMLKDRRFVPLIDIKPHGVRMLLHVGF